MSKLKRLVACLLATCTLASLLVAPVGAVGGSAFTDISDPKVAESAEVLRLLNIVSGTGGSSFNPSGSLSRAEFCKMTVEALGRGDEEPGQRNRTIFLDVGPSHWARGYINLASSIPLASGGGDKESTTTGKLITGVGDGTFRPERHITFGEAVAILTRVLGHNEVSVGVNWYDGPLSIAKTSGLSSGLELSGTATLTRGQAATLFYNLLFTKPKGSESIYLTTLGGKKEDGGILLSVSTTATDGTKGAVKTTTGTYKTDRTTMDTSLEGLQGELMLDKDGKLLAFLPKENLTRRSVSVTQWAYNKITISGDETLDLPPESTVYKDGEKTTYEKLWKDLRPGTSLTIYYTTDGKVDYAFLQSVTTSERAMVARNKPASGSNPFASLTGSQTGYAIYKNGIPATVEDIRQYDVATYDKNAKVMNISDLRLTGIYENVYPNTATPARVKVMGAEFTVLPSAANDLQNFKIGELVTLLLTRDGQVAGAVSSSATSATAVGVVTKITDGSESSNASAEVKLLNNSYSQPLSGTIGYQGDGAKQLLGQLVVVSSHSIGRLTLSTLNSGNSNVTGTLDVANRKLGGVALAENVKLYERVGTGTPVEITMDQLTRANVPAAKILYASKDYAGRYNILVFDDVTGDLYTYGLLSTGQLSGGVLPGGTEAFNPTVSVATDELTAKDGWKNNNMTLRGSANVTLNSFGGIAPALEAFDGINKLAGYVTLSSISGVRRAAFDMDAMTVTTTDMVLPISPHVVSYNKTTKTWFKGEDSIDALELARAYSDTLTLYYDKAPEEGGKVRIVVVE